MKKKIVAVCMTLALAANVGILPMCAEGSGDSRNEEYIINSEKSDAVGMSDSATIADVDELMDEYTQAMLTDNKEEQERIDKELESIGVREVGTEEAAKLTGETDEDIPAVVSHIIMMQNICIKIVAGLI